MDRNCEFGEVVDEIVNRFDWRGKAHESGFGQNGCVLRRAGSEG